jgi:hypothetical protein
MVLAISRQDGSVVVVVSEANLTMGWEGQMQHLGVSAWSPTGLHDWAETVERDEWNAVKRGGWFVFSPEEVTQIKWFVNMTSDETDGASMIANPVLVRAVTKAIRWGGL